MRAIGVKILILVLAVSALSACSRSNKEPRLLNIKSSTETG